MDKTEQIEKAKRNVQTARRMERIANTQRQAGSITKSCHREAVRTRKAAERRLVELEAS